MFGYFPISDIAFLCPLPDFKIFHFPKPLSEKNVVIFAVDVDILTVLIV